MSLKLLVPYSISVVHLTDELSLHILYTKSIEIIYCRITVA